MCELPSLSGLASVLPTRLIRECNWPSWIDEGTSCACSRGLVLHGAPSPLHRHRHQPVGLLSTCADLAAVWPVLATARGDGTLESTSAGGDIDDSMGLACTHYVESTNHRDPNAALYRNVLGHSVLE